MRSTRFLIALFLVPAAFAYIRLYSGGTSPSPLFRVDNAGIQFYVNSKIAAGYQSSASGKSVTVIASDSNPVAAIRSALATWNAVGANVKFLPLKSTDAGIADHDFQMTIAFAENKDDVSAMNGALALTLPRSSTQPANLQDGQLIVCDSNCTYAVGAVFDSDIMLNPNFSFSTTGSTDSDLQSVITHELGHSLGLSHSTETGATMYAYTFPSSKFVWRNLTTDEVIFAKSLYSAGGANSSGSISGTVAGNGGAVIPYALLTFVDTTNGNVVSGLADVTGKYSVTVAPGNYLAYAEPFSASVQPLNLYLSDTTTVIPAFQPTVYGAAGTPTTLNVTAGATATANITVTSGTSTAKLIYYGFGAAGKSGDVLSLNPVANPNGINIPIVIASGNSIDFAFIGTGLDSALTDANFHVYGQGISVHPGSVRVDKTVSFPQGPLIRATLDIPARQNQTLASIFANTASGTLALSGIFVVTPPTPVFTPAAVVSAAPYVGVPSGVTPGGIYSIYSPDGSPLLGPGGVDATKLVLNGPYDAYGSLPTTLAGVSVTFDGIPAPMFLAWGNQLNFQVPFEVAGKTTTKVVVNYLGSQSAAVSVPVLKVQPSFFTSDGKAVRAYNLKDGTVNSPDHPAGRGDFVEVYGTGVGQVSYAIPTGQGAPGLPAGYTGNYTYSIGGSASAPALFGGYTPTAVGLAQWDLKIPDNSATGTVPITVTDPTGVSSPPSMTIYVK